MTMQDQRRTHRRAGAILSQVAAFAMAALLAACGGGGGGGGSGGTAAAPAPGSGIGGTPAAAPAPSSPAPAPAPSSANNVLPIVVDRGTDGTAINSPFVSVTVCEPGTQNCQTIDHVLVDTGSFGLRILASALQAGTNLPPVTAAGGAPLAECASFASGYTWGSVRTADVRLAGQRADALPLQVIRDTGAAYATVPTACSNTGPALRDAGANGILGVGFFQQDCGAACVSSAAPNVYFACPATGCIASTAPLASQVANPVARLDSNNNGVAISMPSLATGGAASLSGSLIFGVGTSENNQLAGRPVYKADSRGNFTTVYKGQSTPAFIDSGSNGIFFNDTGIPQCAGGFYCPPSVLSLSGQVGGTNGSSSDVGFQVENASTLPAGSGAAHLAGSIGLASTFDWGLPFFFGRTVFVALDGATAAGGQGPYWSF